MEPADGIEVRLCHFGQRRKHEGVDVVGAQLSEGGEVGDEPGVLSGAPAHFIGVGDALLCGVEEVPTGLVAGTRVFVVEDSVVAYAGLVADTGIGFQGAPGRVLVDEAPGAQEVREEFAAPGECLEPVVPPVVEPLAVVPYRGVDVLQHALEDGFRGLLRCGPEAVARPGPRQCGVGVGLDDSHGRVQLGVDRDPRRKALDIREQERAALVAVPRGVRVVLEEKEPVANRRQRVALSIGPHGVHRVGSLVRRGVEGKRAVGRHAGAGVNGTDLLLHVSQLGHVAIEEEVEERIEVTVHQDIEGCLVERGSLVQATLHRFDREIMRPCVVQEDAQHRFLEVLPRRGPEHRLVDPPEDVVGVCDQVPAVLEIGVLHHPPGVPQEPVAAVDVQEFPQPLLAGKVGHDGGADLDVMRDVDRVLLPGIEVIRVATPEPGVEVEADRQAGGLQPAFGFTAHFKGAVILLDDPVVAKQPVAQVVHAGRHTAQVDLC